MLVDIAIFLAGFVSGGACLVLYGVARRRRFRMVDDALVREAEIIRLAEELLKRGSP